MSKKHVVRAGECISSLARQAGFSPEALWEHPDNEELRKVRTEPNVLADGDAVMLPERSPRVAEVQAGGTHRFTVNNRHAVVRLHLVLGGEAVADEPYVVEAGKVRVEGTTDGDGVLEAKVPASEMKAVLTLPERGLQYELALGHLDPVETVRGASQRLVNLGLLDQEPAAKMSRQLRRALRVFQRMKSLEVTGELDDATREALRDAYGC